jgi:hypothetical protein
MAAVSNTRTHENSSSLQQERRTRGAIYVLIGPQWRLDKAKTIYGIDWRWCCPAPIATDALHTGRVNIGLSTKSHNSEIVGMVLHGLDHGGVLNGTKKGHIVLQEVDKPCFDVFHAMKDAPREALVFPS